MVSRSFGGREEQHARRPRTASAGRPRCAPGPWSRPRARPRCRAAPRPRPANAGDPALEPALGEEQHAEDAEHQDQRPAGTASARRRRARRSRRRCRAGLSRRGAAGDDDQDGDERARRARRARAPPGRRSGGLRGTNASTRTPISGHAEDDQDRRRARSTRWTVGGALAAAVTCWAPLSGEPWRRRSGAGSCMPTCVHACASTAGLMTSSSGFGKKPRTTISDAAAGRPTHDLAHVQVGHRGRALAHRGRSSCAGTATGCRARRARCR